MNELKDCRKTTYVDVYYLAPLLDALGKRREAIAELGRAIEENSATLYMIDVDPKMDTLRSDPGFSKLRNVLFASGSAEPVELNTTS